jgi:AGZA family xanthine/uracil permease-like MFS transporter
MGGRIGYSAATGVMVIVLSWFGIIALMMALIPVVAISPILLYIGMLIGAQAFQETPRSARAGDRAGAGAADRRLGQDADRRRARRRRHQRAAVGLDKLDQTGVLYQGLEILGGGATLFGLIHAEAMGIGRTPSMVASYLGISIILLACTRYAKVAPRTDEAEAMHGHGAQWPDRGVGDLRSGG